MGQRLQMAPFKKTAVLDSVCFPPGRLAQLIERVIRAHATNNYNKKKQASTASATLVVAAAAASHLSLFLSLSLSLSLLSG